MTNQKAALCREIGSFFGKYSEKNGIVSVDTGEREYYYNSHDDMLKDWVDTLIESQHDNGGNWEKEIAFIYEETFGKYPEGVRRVKNARFSAWKVYVDVRNPNHPHGKNIHLGTYDSIVFAMISRKDYIEYDLLGIDTTAEEGLQAAIEKGKMRQVLAKNIRKHNIKMQNSCKKFSWS